MHDVRYALRWLRGSPGFAAVAILSLGLGIGLNTAIFSVVDALLLRPLPVTQPERLVDVYTSLSATPGAAGGFSTHSVPDLDDYRAQNGVFDDMIGYSMMFAAVGRDRPRLTLGETVTGNYFDVLGVRAVLGRPLQMGDEAPGAPRVVALSERYWRRNYGGDRNAIGQILHIRAQPYTIVGVIEDRFTGMVPLLAAEIWTTIRYVDDIEPAGINEVVPSPTGTTRLDRRGTRWLFVKGRLRAGTTVDQARANLDAIAARLRETHPQTNKETFLQVRAASETRLHPQADGLLTWMLTGTMIAVGLVLAIACANVAGMLLARASARHRELAIRLAIGASRWRIVRQLLTESAVLGAIGAALGVVLAAWVTRFFTTIDLPLPIPLSLDLRVDGRVLAFTAAVAIFTGLLAGLAPALRASRTSVVMDIKGAPEQARVGRIRWSVRDALVVSQMAVTVVLLVTAALLVRSLLASRAADVGFPTAGLAIVSGDTSMVGYTPERSAEFWKEVERRVRALPGVERVATASRLPFSLNFNMTTVAVPGHVKGPEETGPAHSSAIVSPEYFATLGVAVRRGREFAETDTPQSPRVAIVTESFARRYWRGGSAVGQRVFERNLNSGRGFDIVGVVADHKLQTVGEDVQPAIFFAASQRPDSYRVMMARTSGDDAALVRDMTRTLLELEPSLPIFEQQTMAGQLSGTLLPLRAGAFLVGVFSALGLLLAAIGLYGVIAFAVARRTREIGIRVAIGAQPRDVMRLILRQGLTIAGAGLLLGLLLAAGATRVVSSALYGVAAMDLVAWGGAAIVLLLTAALANALPAVRAMRIDPVRALRTE
jgi:predicted permease